MCLSHFGGIVSTLLPSTVLNKSLFELLYQKEIQYTTFRVFGCLCHSSTVPSKTQNSYRSYCICLGHPMSYKGYKLYDIEKNTIFIF
ncbi:hypothetical protein JHK86_005275 [Glycine max]|nr:hypothetical protein JHK86_005275 [Glycine max]